MIVARTIALLALTAVLSTAIAPPLPSPPQLVRVTCGPRVCTIAWKLAPGVRSGAVLLAPARGLLLQSSSVAGRQSTRVEVARWRLGQPLEVLEWGRGWERRTRWTPTTRYFPFVGGR